MATPTIPWRAHTPRSDADLTTRLRCIMLDILSSSDLPNESNQNGLYIPFEDHLTVCLRKDFNIATFDLSHYENPSRTILSQMRIKAIRLQIATRCNVKPWDATYTISADATALNEWREIVTLPRQAGQDFYNPFQEKISIQWTVGHAEENAALKLVWADIVAILHHWISMKYEENGEQVTETEYKKRMKATPDPLFSRGFLGWPERNSVRILH